MARIVRWEPLNDLASFRQQDIDRVFRTLAESLSGFGSIEGADWVPSTDVLTRGNDLVIRMEVPGIDPEKDVEITVENGMLHIRGRREQTQEEETEGYIRREMTFGSFARTLPLPSGVSTDDLKANYEDGVLEIVVPGAAKRPAQRVQVQAKSQGKKKVEKQQ
jgi:HSP20 family protein